MPTSERFDAVALRAVLTAFRDAVHAHAPRLNRLNVYPVPDGDTGTNMARTLDAVVDALADAASGSDATCDAISHGSLMGARGNSGVILSQILRGVAGVVKHPTEGGEHAEPQHQPGAHDDARCFAAALRAATTGAYQAVLKPVEGTILTVVRESADAADAAVATGAALVDVVEAGRVAGEDALRRTPDLLPVLRDAGVVDAGGAGYLLFFDAVMHVLTGRPVPEPDPDPDPGSAPGPTARAVTGIGGALDVGEQRYEVMFLCSADDAGIEATKSRWSAIGDSIVVVGGDGTWNCHVHTNDIGGVIEAVLVAGGRPRDIRVTDLFEEVADEHARRDASIADADADDDDDADTGHDDGAVVACAVVAVASGPGLAQLFTGLGVGGVVTGGQTSNPSTAELLDAVERVAADAVVVLPNNKNIVAVAEQVDRLTDKSVTVVPTRSMPEGLAALVSFDSTADPTANRATMAAAASDVLTGEITRAVRDANAPVGPVRVGDWIGMNPDHGIVAVDPVLEHAAIGVLERLLADHHEIVTIVTGADADPAVTAAVEAWLAEHHVDVEVEVHDGGQPLYPYLFGLE